MRHLILPALFVLALLSTPVRAEEPKPDDHVMFDLSVENWVTTKTARVSINVEAAVNSATAGSMRDDMMKAVANLTKGDWRLVSFNRNQDQTGLERWSASYETRLPETVLSGLGDAAKKASKAGMQLSIGEIDFSPTLDEIEAVRSDLRTQIYKKAADQLTALNGTMPGRNYRISVIEFGGDVPMPMYGLKRTMAPMAMNAAAASIPVQDAEAAERSEKIRMTAHVTLAALPASAPAK